MRPVVANPGVQLVASASMQHPDWTLPLAPDDPDGVDLAADALAEEMIAGSDEAGLSDAS